MFESDFYFNGQWISDAYTKLQGKNKRYGKKKKQKKTASRLH